MSGSSSISWIDRSKTLKPQVKNWVDGKPVEVSGPVTEKRGPRDGVVLSAVGSGTPADVASAVSAARHSFNDGRWSELPAKHRKDVLLRLGALIERDRDELALLESLDLGKPISDVLSFDIPASIEILRFAAESTDKIHTRIYAADQKNLSYTLNRPVGVVGAIIGWNFPLLLAATKIGPGLAAGNSLVVKPSELAGYSAHRLAALAQEAGLPDGVLNVVNGGPSIGKALSLHSDVDLLAFTGSSCTGKELLVASGSSNMKRLILECGGKCATIVFDDSLDISKVGAAIVSRAFWNQGQVCTASSRVLVHKRVKHALLEAIVREAADLKLGDPLAPETRLGALVSLAHRDKVLGYVQSGIREGARVAYIRDDPAPFKEGFYVSPVVFGDVSPKQRIAQEEIFGPVLSIIEFSDDDEAVRISNDTIYGLAATVWTRDLARAHRMCQALKSGLVTVNATATPCGGPSEGVVPVGGQKQSGQGLEGGLEGVEAYMSRTTVQMFV